MLQYSKHVLLLSIAALFALPQPGQAQSNLPALPPAADSNNSASSLQTVAELSNYTDTAQDFEVAYFMRELAENWEGSELTSIGQTNEGRELWALMWAPNIAPASAGAAQPPKPLTVLILGGIHSGECDGKEAVLALARDMATNKVGDHWKNLRLIFVPNFNADANERRGLLHRPGQAGPSEGMGLRANAQGLDLNRDFVKLESPEVRSLVNALNVYDVDVLIDTHTTNGSLHQYHLTYDLPHNPAMDPSIDAYVRDSLFPQVSERMLEQGHPTFYYGNFDRAHRKWSTYGYEPRYSTEMMGLRQRIGILSESYSYVSYKTRVEASYHFVNEVLRQLGSDAQNIRQILNKATAARSVPGAALPLGGTQVMTKSNVVAKGFETPTGGTPSGPYGEQALKANKPKDYRVELWNRYEPTKVVKLPEAYVIPAQNAWAVGRLLQHGVAVDQLSASAEANVEHFSIEDVQTSPTFQGHALKSLKVSSESSQATLPAGTYIVRTNQKLGVLAGYILEPESSDSLAAWNFFDPDLKSGQNYPVSRINEGLASLKLKPLSAAEEASLATEQITLPHLAEPGNEVAYGGQTPAIPRWYDETTQYLLTQSGRTVAVDSETGSREPIELLSTFRQKLAEMSAFSAADARRKATLRAFSKGLKFALVKHNGDLFFFDSSEGVVRQLTHTPKAEEELAELSPTGEHVAFVYQNNLWLADCNSTETTQLTTDGSVELLNGKLDWVYQEELYGRGNFKGFWWSQDGSKIAMLQLDQTPVPSYQVSDSISFGQTLEATRYPKAGQPLPTARMWIVDVRSRKMQQVDLSSFDADDRLIGRVSWGPDGLLWLQVFNRVQNQQVLARCDTEGRLTRVMTETSPGWIEIRGTPRFINPNQFLWLSDLPTGRSHLFLVEAKSGARTQLTSGDWDVGAIEGISIKNSKAYVSGNYGAAIDQHLLEVDLTTRQVKPITFAPGTHRVAVNATCEYFIDQHSSLQTQPIVSLHKIDGSFVRALGVPVSNRHEYLDVAAPTHLTIQARDGVELQTLVMLPPNWQATYDEQLAAGDSAVNIEKQVSKLPVIFHVYGGPQAPTIRNAWQGRYHWWHQMLCQQGFAVVLCDNRAARGRGVKDTWTIRGDMGRVELEDLKDAVAWAKQQPWCDGERIGLWGWSYGGYFTSYAMTHSDLFAAGIAGAPVTDWRNYDAIYTERYMDLPQTNQQGYESSSVVEAAENLSGQLLIIHGERDDNVHMSNSLQLAYALQKAGKQFELMIYPKNRHGIVDPEQKYHLRKLMTDFFIRHLKP